MVYSTGKSYHQISVLCTSPSHWEMTDETSAPAKDEQWPELPSSVHHRDYQRTVEWAECSVCLHLDFISFPLSTK